jgi:hypothetical protein
MVVMRCLREGRLAGVIRDPESEGSAQLYVPITSKSFRDARVLLGEVISLNP